MYIGNAARYGAQPFDSNSSSSSSGISDGYSYPQRGTQVVLMADLGVGASDDSADTKVFSEACIPAFNTTKSVGYRVAQGDVDAVLLSGDLSYANGYLSNWDFFLDALSPIAGTIMFHCFMCYYIAMLPAV